MTLPSLIPSIHDLRRKGRSAAFIILSAKSGTELFSANVHYRHTGNGCKLRRAKLREVDSYCLKSDYRVILQEKLTSVWTVRYWN